MPPQLNRNTSIEVYGRIDASRDIEKSQGEVQPTSILYEIQKHVNEDTGIIWTNISMKTQI